MKKVLFFIMMSIQLVTAQSFEIEKLPSRVRLSGEFINMHNEADIGFLGHGYEVFGLIPRFRQLYFGVNAYSALTGIRSGFIVFGVSGGLKKQIYKNWLSIDTGLYLGGGGGSGAPDGGGLMIRPHLDFEVSLQNNLSLRAGISAITFPSGSINSLNFNVGAVIKTNTYLINKALKVESKNTENYFLNNIDLGVSSLNLLNFKKGPLRSDNPNNPSLISLVGLTVKTAEKNNLYGILKLGGAFVGGVDGFMMLMSGIGYTLPVNNWLYFNTNALVGGAGGGDVEFGGGLATQLELGVGFNFKKYYLVFGGGKTYAPNGNFESNNFDISFGKRFKMFGANSKNKIEQVSGSVFKKEGFKFSVFNRTYFSKNKKDKNLRDYDNYFNLIGFELEKILSFKTSIVAATVWAYQGSYGAYAEGWVGVKQNISNINNWYVNGKLLIGAGGGGGINLGSGMAYQYSIEMQKNLNYRWSLLANIGQIRPVSGGNFSPILFDIGVRLNISQLVKK